MAAVSGPLIVGRGVLRRAPFHEREFIGRTTYYGIPVVARVQVTHDEAGQQALKFEMIEDYDFTVELARNPEEWKNDK